MEDTSPADTHDRNDLLATIGVVVVVLAFAVGLPLADTFLAPRSGVVAAGTQVVLSVAHDPTAAALPGRPAAVTFAPAAGWEETTALATRQSSGGLTHDGLSFEVSVEGMPDGTDCAAALRGAGRSLRDLDPSGTLGPPRTFVTDNGEAGLAASFLGTRVEGLVFVVCAGGITVTATATGPIGSLGGSAEDEAAVVTMARSIEIT